MEEILDKRFNEEIKRIGESKIRDPINKDYEMLKSHLVNLNFKDTAIDILSDGLKITLLFDEDRLLMITKRQRIIITFFIKKKLIWVDEIRDLNDFITKFNQYLKNKN